MLWNDALYFEERLCSQLKDVHSMAEKAREAYVLAQAAEVKHTEGEERPLLDGEIIHKGDEMQFSCGNWAPFEKEAFITPWQKFLPVFGPDGKEWITLNSRTKRPLPKAIADPYNLSCFGPRRY